MNFLQRKVSENEREPTSKAGLQALDDWLDLTTGRARVVANVPRSSWGVEIALHLVVLGYGDSQFTH
jgi:hypothetical protein